MSARNNEVTLWEAINEYAAACGGDTSADSVSDRRMDAVCAVNRAIEAEVADRIALRAERTLGSAPRSES